MMPSIRMMPSNETRPPEGTMPSNENVLIEETMPSQRTMPSDESMTTKETMPSAKTMPPYNEIYNTSDSQQHDVIVTSCEI